MAMPRIYSRSKYGVQMGNSLPSLMRYFSLILFAVTRRGRFIPSCRQPRRRSRIYSVYSSALIIASSSEYPSSRYSRTPCFCILMTLRSSSALWRCFTSAT